jgi:riboflavin synthase
MFTGLVEAVGEIAEVKPTPGGVRLRLATALAPELANGDSLAVNGVCLTVVSADADGVHMDVSPETARVTTLGAARRGTLVNLERPLRADGRVGGHFVQGHVDGTGTVEDVREDGDSFWLTILFAQPLAPFIVRKGSIAVNGISLTVAGVDDRRFDVQIIPYTWTHTNLRSVKAGELVNLECDILGKYVARAVELAGGALATPGAAVAPVVSARVAPVAPKFPGRKA